MHIPILDHIANMNLNDMVKFLISYYNKHHVILLPLIIGFFIGRFGRSLLNIFIAIIVVYIILSFVPLHIPDNIFNAT